MEELSLYCRVIVYDMLGHGRSEKAPGPYTLSNFIEQLDGLIHYLEKEKVHIAGFSMGGMVAQAFAIERPQKVASLAIISAVANRTFEQRKGVLSRLAEVEANGQRGTIEAAIERWFNKKFIIQNPEMVQQVRKRLQENDPASYLAAYRVFATGDAELYQRLDKIKCPTLVLTGEFDVGSTPHMAKLMENRIPHSEVVIIPGIKHMLPLEGAGILNEKLLSFLSELGVIDLIRR